MQPGAAILPWLSCRETRLVGQMSSAPRVFISYSWTSREHQQWVLDLATQLRENGVDIIIDKWDLKEGNDAIAFMERMITDPDIRKVIVVLDCGYSEKADSKKGGVGAESQIISPEVYAKTDQNKFVGVISELDADGKPFLPAFYKSRIYIDLSSSDLYGTNFDQLLRWIFDRPAFPKPPLGKAPEFLSETVVLLPTRTRARRAIDLLRAGVPAANGAVDEYFSLLAESFENLRLKRSEEIPFDDQVIESIGAFVPYRDEFIEVIFAIVRFGSDDTIELVHRLFEKVIPYLDRPKSVNPWSEDDFDNFRFIIHEMFLYFVAVLLRSEKFETLNAFLAKDFYAGDVSQFSHEPMQRFSVFRPYLRSLKARNKRLQLRRISLHADLLKDRAEASGLAMRDLMQADFALFLRDAFESLKDGAQQSWWPVTLLYFQDYTGPFEIFARSVSSKYFARLRQVLALENKMEFVDALKHFGYSNSRLFLPKWEGHFISLEKAANIEKLDTRP